MSEKVANYYLKKKTKLLKEFDNHLIELHKLLDEKYNEKKSIELIKKMKETFENILPNIPYIGGQKNPTTMILTRCVSDLAIFRVLEEEGFAFKEIGEIHYNYSIKNHKVRRKMLEKAGRDPSNYPFDPVYVDYQKKLTEETQKRIYPDDWVMEFVEGDGKKFDWGWDIYECGVQKAYKKLGGEKYLPFICLGDHYEAEALGFGFSRTQTLGFGASICDHRFIKNNKTPPAWPPYDLKEFNKNFFEND
jgi:hypothetical protein